MSDERNIHLSINSNDQLQEELHPRPGKQMEDPKPKPLEGENNLIASKPNALMIGESKINIEEISEEVPDNDFAGMKQTQTRSIGRFQGCMCLKSFTFWIGLFATLNVNNSN